MTRRAVRAFALVELMVSLAIGLVVVGALIAAYQASAQSARHTRALLQMSDDASAALDLIRSQVEMAGYSRVLGVDASGLRRHPFPAIFGCDGAAFADPTRSMLAGVSCATTPARSDALAVAYEASRVAGPGGRWRSNSVLGASEAPLDCLGNGFSRVSEEPTPYHLNDTRLYLADGRLYCHGPGNPAGAPVVDNIDDLQLTYGLATPSAPGEVAYYADAPPAGDPAWNHVLAVTACVLVRSAERVVTDADAAGLAGYADCANRPRRSTDGYLRRSFSTTILLENRLP